VADQQVSFVGEFNELEHGNPDGPSLRSAVRDHAGMYAHELVAYLRSGAVLAATVAVVRDVLAPDSAAIGGLQVLTDGRWLWYSDLAHYVDRYHVELDPRFVAHAQRSNWTIPQVSRAELLALEAVFLSDSSG
jgi:hypothetical protein